ncbi:hypothetical protein [Rhodococcus oxybenzonivorans]|uniref:hypothetical protein n=1 Tax=Rhodococcus oxybenzonivorans TaxID=1990687 RepID=UPI002953DC0A|nr:hypothetical protein [Rhodococcus oxybenzonivorans]
MGATVRSLPPVPAVSARSSRTRSPDNSSKACARILRDRKASTISGSSSTNADNHRPTARQWPALTSTADR